MKENVRFRKSFFHIYFVFLQNYKDYDMPLFERH